MTGMIAQFLTWPTLGIALLVFGFAPGAVLRLILLFYRRGNPRRQELLGELYAVPRIERPFWVAEQLEVALFEGLRDRVKARLDGPATRIDHQLSELRELELDRNLLLHTRLTKVQTQIVATSSLADDVQQNWTVPWLSRSRKYPPKEDHDSPAEV